MKLDSIVYDINSLRSAITTQLNNESPTFQAMYPSDTATSLVNVLASYGSMLQYQLVSAMANCYTETAYSEAGIYQLAETLGNRLHGNISSEIYCDVTRTNLKGISNVIIPSGSKFTIGDLNFFNPESIVFPLQLNTITNVKLIQGVLQTSEQITSGISGEKLYFCSDFKCNTNLVKVYVNDEEWEITDSFLPYVITDTSVAEETNMVILKTDPDGRTYIKFGNNTNGVIPASGSVVRIEYVSNEGANGNLNTTDISIKLSTPIYYTTINNKREQLEVEIYATSTASGGFNTQSLDVLRESSPYIFGSGQRAVRRNDYKAMLLNQCGYLTCNVWGEYEAAAMYGGYDKIMMNMVYYTGIKSIQKYDLQPVADLSLSLSQINAMPEHFYPISSTIASARGFLGSYLIDIASYNKENESVVVKYRDASGTGILTCDPSVNSDLGDSNKIETTLFPVNDFNTVMPVIDVNQNKTKESKNNPELLLVPNDNLEFMSSGLTKLNDQPSLITFDNPFQIELTYATRKTIAALAFKTPIEENLGHFIGQFAVYGTNEVNASRENIKNNSQWTRLCEMQTLNSGLDAHNWSDWITLNTYVPDNSSDEEEDLSSQCLSEAKTTFTISTLVGGKDIFTYKLEVDGIYWVEGTDYTINSDGTLITINQQARPGGVPQGSQVILHGITSTWLFFKYYVIEVYTLYDASLKSPTKVSLKQIKAIYKDSASTICYNNNNLVNLNIPIVDISNKENVYTRENAEPFTRYWLSTTEGGAPLTPDLTKVYYTVADNATRKNVVTIDEGGTGYAIDDVLTLKYYNYTASLTQAGSGYAVDDIVMINGLRAKIIATTGDATLLDVQGPVNKSIEEVTPQGGTGTGAVFTIVATPSTTDPTSGYSKNVKLKVTALGTGEAATSIAGVSFEENEISYCDQNGEEIEVLSTTGSGTGAKFKIVSAKQNTYRNKAYRYTNGSAYEEVTENLKRLCLPDSMQYYEYFVTLSGLTEENGYKTNDTLVYSINVDNITYVFTVEILNITIKEFRISVSMDNSISNTILRGKSGLTIQNGNLSYQSGTAGIGHNGKISITSKPTVSVMASYTGNFYTNEDIQAFDLPILDKYNHFTTYIEFKQPHIKNIAIELNLEYENVTTYQTVKSNVIKAINALFDIKPYSIGKTLNVSDIWKAINEVAGVKRFMVLSPTTNIDCMKYELITLPAENLIINDILNSEYK